MIDINKIQGFMLKHSVKGRETTTRFSKDEFPLFKQWVESCKKSGFDYQAYVIENDGSLEPIQ